MVNPTTNGSLFGGGMFDDTAGSPQGIHWIPLKSSKISITCHEFPEILLLSHDISVEFADLSHGNLKLVHRRGGDSYLQIWLRRGWPERMAMKVFEWKHQL